MLAVRGPVQHAVIGAAARRHRADIGIEGQLAGLAARRGHDPDLPRAGVLRGECDPLAVGRELRIKLLSLVGGQALRNTAHGRCSVDVAAVHERDLLPMNVRETQQAGIVRADLGRDSQQDQGQEQHGPHRDLREH